MESIGVAADIVRIEDVVEPDEDEAATYARVRPTFAGLYDALEPAFRALQTLAEHEAPGDHRGRGVELSAAARRDAPVSIIGLDHVQVAAPPGCEADARRFYGGVLGLAEVAKPEALAARGGVWFALGPGQRCTSASTRRSPRPARRTPRSSCPPARSRRSPSASSWPCCDRARGRSTRSRQRALAVRRGRDVTSEDELRRDARSASRGATTPRSRSPSTTPRGRSSTRARRRRSGPRSATASSCSSTPARPRSPASRRSRSSTSTLAVADTTAEGDYVPPLEAAGYVLRIREPDWYEHRMFKGTDPDVNLHVFSTGCEEIGRMLRFRDRLRSSPEDRDLYLARKRELATRSGATRRTTRTRRARWWRRSWGGLGAEPRRGCARRGKCRGAADARPRCRSRRNRRGKEEGASARARP